MPKLELLAERPIAADSPWTLSDTGDTHVRLWGGTTDGEVGDIVAQLAAYNDGIDASGGQLGVVERLAEADHLLLPGGVGVRGDADVIHPGCCCGLEAWRDWFGGESLWMGHDPSPWREFIGPVVRIWSDGGLENAPDAFCVEFDRGEYDSNLTRLSQDFRDFLERLRSWVAVRHRRCADAVVDRFDTCFQVTTARQE